MQGLGRSAVIVLVLLTILFLATHSIVEARFCRVVWTYYYRYDGYKISYPLWCCGFGYNMTCSRVCARRGGLGPCW